MNRALSLMVVSADSALCESIRRMVLSASPECTVFAHAWAAQAVRTADVALIDAQDWPRMLEMVPRIKAQVPEVEVVLLTQRGQATQDMLLQAMRSGVREVLYLPVDQHELAAALARFQHEHPGRMRSPGKVLSVMPCKAGCGASFIAANLADLLAQASAEKVLLIDLNLQFGDCALYLTDRRISVSIVDVLREIDRIDPALMMAATSEISKGFHVLAAPEDPSAAEGLRGQDVDALIRFARGQFAYVVIDTPLALDSITLAALDAADQVYPVIQLNMSCLRNARRLFEVYRKLAYAPSKLRPIVNRHGAAQPSLGVADVEGVMKHPVFFSVPNDYPTVSSAIEQGRTLSSMSPRHPICRSLRELAERVIERPTARRGGFLSRLLRAGTALEAG